MSKEQWKKELEPFAILAAGVNEDLENRSEEDLQALLDACQQPTSTNCWCWTYQAAKWIGPLVAEELARRDYANKRHNVEFSGGAPLFGAASAGTKGYTSATETRKA